MTSGPAAALADALAAFAATLRHHRDLGFAELVIRTPPPLPPAEALRQQPAKTQRQPPAEALHRQPAEALRQQEAALQDCQRCPLGAGRRTVVFGSGNPTAGIMVIGEGPGADEDAQGLPFVGRAGQLLTRMLASVQLERDEVYITNTVKCRPPGNRNPESEEIAACAPFLQAQLGVIRPQVVIALGSVATKALLGTKEGIGKLRGQCHSFAGAVLVPTFHPAFLLRSPGPEYRRMAWEDLKLAKREYERLREQ